MSWFRRETDAAMQADLAAMRRYARSLARDGHDADDVVQDALVRAIERQRSFQPERNRRRWLLAIVHNVFVSSRRRAAAEGRRNDRFAQEMIAHVAPDQEQHAQLAAIARAFAALSEAHRAVIHLVVIEGLSYQATANILQVPIGTVMSRLARARVALREKETQQGEPTRLRLIGGDDD